MQITIGDLGAVTGVLVYRPSLSANHFRTPHIIAIAYLLFAIINAGALWFWMACENGRRREALVAGNEKTTGVVGDAEEEEKTRLGDRHVRWRYVY
jgi:hypothetical protein